MKTETEYKHTPGPWSCNPVPSKISYNNRTFEIHGFETETYVRDVLESEIDANAELIAQAPSLLQERDTLREANKELIEILKGFIEIGDLDVKKPSNKTLAECYPLLYKKAIEYLFEHRKGE